MPDGHGTSGTWNVVVLVDGDEEVGTFPLVGYGRPDLWLVDSLARFQLAARRLGIGVRVRRPCGELRDLLALAGLDEVIPEAE